jgi:hypothetical protein
MENPIVWLVIVTLGAAYLVLRVLESMRTELKAIRLTLEEIERRERAEPKSLSERATEFRNRQNASD